MTWLLSSREWLVKYIYLVLIKIESFNMLLLCQLRSHQHWLHVPYSNKTDKSTSNLGVPAAINTTSSCKTPLPNKQYSPLFMTKTVRYTENRIRILQVIGYCNASIEQISKRQREGCSRKQPVAFISTWTTFHHRCVQPPQCRTHSISIALEALAEGEIGFCFILADHKEANILGMYLVVIDLWRNSKC